MGYRTIALSVLLLCASEGYAQVKGYFANWDNRVRKTMGQQPDWVVPLVADPAGVYQLLRVDNLREISSAHVTSWNYGDDKGFILIPWYKTELDLFTPPYVQYSPTGKDGFGDPEFQLKYRPWSANNEHGDYSVNFGLEGSIPTGSYKNGSPTANVIPNFSVGKGRGSWDVQTHLEAKLPVSQGGTLGRPITWDTVIQDHPGSVFWPELEDDTTFNVGGPSGGTVQNFLLPGLMFDQFRLLHHRPSNRLALLFGAGIQIATTHYHSYDHSLVITGRLNF
ncbi:MAG: transporter [Acidobacteriaceae bacterium]